MRPARFEKYIAGPFDENFTNIIEKNNIGLNNINIIEEKIISNNRLPNFPFKITYFCIKSLLTILIIVVERKGKKEWAE